MGVLLGGSSTRRDGSCKTWRHHEFSLDMFVTSNFAGRVTRVSPSVTRVLGYSREEFLARPFLERIHPDDIERTEAAVARQAEGEELLDFQNRHRAKDGTYRWLEWTSRPDLEAGEMLAVARDVTERKESEARERAYQERLERAVNERTTELERTTRGLAESHHETLTRLALAAEYRDDDTQAHTYRVADTAARIALELGLEGHEVKLIREAALLHDVGKVGIPDAILLKAGPLSGEEFDVVKTHPEIGRSILAGSRSGILRAAEEIAAFHHEWWDGSGYPYGLVGEAIPLAARIVALADVFDALTHARPYKPAWPRAEALAGGPAPPWRPVRPRRCRRVRGGRGPRRPGSSPGWDRRAALRRGRRCRRRRPSGSLYAIAGTVDAQPERVRGGLTLPSVSFFVHSSSVAMSSSRFVACSLTLP